MSSIESVCDGILQKELDWIASVGFYLVAIFVQTSSVNDSLLSTIVRQFWKKKEFLITYRMPIVEPIAHFVPTRLVEQQQGVEDESKVIER